MLHPRFLTPYFALVLVVLVCLIWALSYVRRYHCAPNSGRLPFRRPGTPHGYQQPVWKDLAQQWWPVAQAVTRLVWAAVRPALAWPFRSCLHFLASFALTLVLFATLPLLHFPTDCDPGGYGRETFGLYRGQSPTPILKSSDMTPLLSFRDVSDRAATSISDPHVVVDPDEPERLYLFFAVQTLNSKSEIAVATSIDGGDSFDYKQVVLPRTKQDAFALSHPYVFNYNGHWYMMPIHDLTRGLPIYKATANKFPLEWKYSTTLLQDHENRRSYFMYAHATIIEKEGLWWLFAYTDTHSLYAFSSKTPLEDASWTAHTKNPVQSHALPPAGPMVVAPSSNKLTNKVPGGSNGGTTNVYRFIHDDTARSVLTVQVTLLTPTEYREEIIDDGNVSPAAAGWNSKAISHVSPWRISAAGSSKPHWAAIATGRGPCVYSYCSPPPTPLKLKKQSTSSLLTTFSTGDDDEDDYDHPHEVHHAKRGSKHNNDNADDVDTEYDESVIRTPSTPQKDTPTDDDRTSASGIKRPPIWPENVVVATACNSNHLLSTQYTLRSLQSLGARAIFYDLGLTEEERESLPLWPGLEFRIFPFADYPSHFDMRFEAGQYAWKPIMIGEMADEILGLDPDPVSYVYPYGKDFQPWKNPPDVDEAQVDNKNIVTFGQLCGQSAGDALRYAQGPLGKLVVQSGRGGGLAARRRHAMRGMMLIWVDGASVLHTLKLITKEVRGHTGGFWARTSADSMQRWTHPSTFQWFWDHGYNFTMAAMGPRQPAEAGFAAFNLEANYANRDKLWCEIIEPWRRCSLYSECIGPAGSNGKNHRQDQSILSFLFNKQQLDQPGHYEWGTADKDAVQVSIKCDRWFYKYFWWLLHFSQNQFAYFCKR